MKQHEAVIQVLEARGGIATLAELYNDALNIKECKWNTKTPQASIRRIVQDQPEIFKVRPGLWALESYRKQLGLANIKDTATLETILPTHSYYQGILCVLGNLEGYNTFIPHQDKNKRFVRQTLNDVRSLPDIPHFSYPFFVQRSSTIDTIWFNQRQMPHAFFEVEYSTDFQNSLIKFVDLQDFAAKMVIVSDETRRNDFNYKMSFAAFAHIKQRVEFWNYQNVVKQYESAVVKHQNTT